MDYSETLFDLAHISAVIVILLIGKSTLTHGEAILPCYDKSYLFSCLFVGINLLFYLTCAVEKALNGSSVLLELDLQVKELTRPEVMEASHMTWDIVKVVAMYLLSTAIFHIRARSCECTNWAITVPGGCRVRG